MELTRTEVAIIYFNLFVLRPPIFLYHYLSKLRRRQLREWQPIIPLAPAAELQRKMHEEANRAHGFMKLPGELRNRIYSMAMISGAVLDPVWGPIHELKYDEEENARIEKSSTYPEYSSQLYRASNGYESNQTTWMRMRNMSQVCRVWRQEALLHFYGNNIFKLPIGKHLHERTRRASTYAIPNAWRYYWKQTSPGPAGPFARRFHYTPWLRSRPKEIFVALRLVLHDYRDCPHFTRSTRRPHLRGDCMILLHFSGQEVSLRAVKDTYTQDTFKFWGCEICWRRFGESLGRVERDEDMRKLFAAFRDDMSGTMAIKVVDGVRKILWEEYERE